MSRSIVLTLTLLLLPTAHGCGDSAKDVSQPVQVTDEMLRQAEASSNFLAEQSKPAKKAAAQPK